MIKLVALLDTVAAAHSDALEAASLGAHARGGRGAGGDRFATAETGRRASWRCSPRAASSSRITWTSTTRPAPPRSRPTGTCTRRCTAASPTRPAALTKTWRGTRPSGKNDADAPTRAGRLRVLVHQGGVRGGAPTRRCRCQPRSRRSSGPVGAPRRPRVAARRRHGARRPRPAGAPGAGGGGAAPRPRSPCRARRRWTRWPRCAWAWWRWGAARRIGRACSGSGAWTSWRTTRGRPRGRAPGRRNGENLFFGAAFADDVERGGPRFCGATPTARCSCAGR